MTEDKDHLAMTRDGLMVGIMSTLESLSYADTLDYGLPLEPADVKALEKDVSVRFPHFYRRFLIEVGSSLGTGRDFGVLDVYDALQASPRPARPFSFGHQETRLAVQKMLAESETMHNAGTLPFDRSQPWDTVTAPEALRAVGRIPFEGDITGALLLHKSTSGGDDAWLVVKGPLQGTIWCVNAQGWYPAFRVNNLDPEMHNFLSWLRSAAEAAQ